MSTKKTLLKWEWIGVAVIFLGGSLLHFVYEWSGSWPPAALVAAVNESTWEHLKMAFWPGFFYALMEYAVLRRGLNNFWLGKFLGLLCMPLVIVMLFYGYKAVLGRSFLPFDLVIFLLAAVTGQMISFRFLTSAPLSTAVRGSGVAGLGILLAVFSLFTYFPPHLFLFQDTHNLSYGLTVAMISTANTTLAGGLACPSDFCRPAQLEDAVRQQCANATSRSLDDFKQLTLQMNFTQMCAAVGPPDWDTGSGLAISVYDLADESRMLIGFAGPDEMFYIHHLLKDGTTQVILSR
jgi:hypothetical protein